MQFREPTVLDMVPMPHAMAAVKPGVPQYEPIGHIWPAEAPVSGQNIPTGQGILDVRLLVGHIDPAGHAVGNRDWTGQKNPALHGAGATLKMPT